MFIFRAPYFSWEFMTTQFRQATHNDHAQIWAIIEKAILRRKNDGSNQWQDGYPNPTVISNDINKNASYVLTSNETIVGYCAVLINDEPEYKILRKLGHKFRFCRLSSPRCFRRLFRKRVSKKNHSTHS